MNALRAAFAAACLAAAGLAQQDQPIDAPDAPGAPDPIGRLSRSTDAELEKSVQELNRLRERVANEKLPLAQELTGLEERVIELRREHERLNRQVDSENLAIAGAKADIQFRQDELTYVGNFLDEYVRTFESKVDVSELQYCGATLDAAKQAAENDTLPPSERFARQIAFVDVSLARAFDALGGMRFRGVGVDPQGGVKEGQFAILGPVALFRADAGSAGLVVRQSESTLPLIRPLEGALQTALATLVETGEGLLPLDPSRGGALKALVQKTNLIHVFEKGGPIMWPLLVASILALAVVLERCAFLLVERRKRDPRAVENLLAEVEHGRIAEAIRIGRETKDFVARTLGYALEHKERSLSAAVLYAQQQELKRFRRGISILDTVITLAPLLGLLGTVTGMMSSFALIGGELSAPGAITGGIAEALIATAFGLGIAIVSLLPFNLLNTKLDEASHEIQSAATQLELLVQPHAAPAPHRSADDRMPSPLSALPHADVPVAAVAPLRAGRG